MFNSLPSLLKDTFAAFGILSVAAFAYKILDLVYLHAICPSRLQRYQHGPPNSKTPAPQESKAWALVTGASDGIGFQLASELARTGFNIVLHGRNESKLAAKIDLLKSKFPQTEFRTAVADGYESHGMRRRIAEIAADMASLPGPLTVVVNNAGGLPSRDVTVFADQPAADIDHIINLNIRFPTQLTRELLPLLKQNAPGLVVVIGSAAADVNAPYITLYSSSKSYLKVWTQAVAAEMELEGHDIEVLGINTGVVAGAGGNNDVSTFFAPSAAVFAKSMLGMVGCGRAWVFGYWAHAVQFILVMMLPGWVLKRLTLMMVKDSQSVRMKSA